MSSCPAFTVADAPVAVPQSHKPVLQLGHWFRGMTRVAHKCATLGQRIVAAAIGSVWLLMMCKTTIGCVSAYDTYLTIKYAESLDIYEQNPLGRWLMGLDQGPVCDTQQIAAFITAKFLGTLLVLIAIQGLAYWRVRVAGLVATPVALCQLYLVAHLMFGLG